MLNYVEAHRFSFHAVLYLLPTVKPVFCFFFVFNYLFCGGEIQFVSES